VIANTRLKVIVWGIALGLLIAIVASLVAISQTRAVDKQAAIRALGTAHAVQVHIAAERLRNVEHLAATIIAEPSLFTGVVQVSEVASPGDPPADVTPLHDQLELMRRASGLKAAAILDATGKKITTAGDISFASIDFASMPVVALAIKNSAPASGIVEGENRVHVVAVNPLKKGPTIVGLLLCADQFDEASVRTAAQAGQTDLALLALKPDGARVLSSTLDGGEARDLPALASSNQADWRSRAGAPAPEPFDIEIGGRTWTALAVRLRPSTANTVLLSLVPPATSDGVIETIVAPLLAGVFAGLIALAVVLFMLWQRIIGPMATMVELSSKAKHGDYALAIKTASSGLAGRLALAFNHLLNELDRHRAPPGTPRRRATDRK